MINNYLYLLNESYNSIGGAGNNGKIDKISKIEYVSLYLPVLSSHKLIVDGFKKGGVLTFKIPLDDEMQEFDFEDMDTFKLFLEAVMQFVDDEIKVDS